ncbi:MAG: alpha/beta hydrolase [Elainella sp.]
MPFRWVSLCLSLGLGLGMVIFTSRPAVGAERIYLKYGPMLFSLPLEDLATYVQEGQVTPAFASYARNLDEATLSQLRRMLQQSYQMDEVAVYRMTQTPIVADLLRSMGEVINTPSGLNGFHAIRSALVLAAAEPGDWTMLDVLRHFPTDIRINVDRVQSLLSPAPTTQPTTQLMPQPMTQPATPRESFNLLY